MTPVLGRVVRHKRETHDTFTLDIRREDGHPHPFAPGQFNMLYVFGVGEVPISICGDPTKPQVISHTTREVGLVTGAMRRLRRGHTVGIRGPFGVPWPIEEVAGKDVIFIAGGIGLAPLRPAILHLMAHRAQYRRAVVLYGARTPEDILFDHDLSRWSGKLDVEVFVTVDRASRQWRGSVGVLTNLIPRAPFDPAHAVAFVCGPEIMMRFTVDELHRRGVRSDQIYVSMERNMKCAIGLCGHCQYGASFVCKDGPVFRFDHVEERFNIREY